MKAVPSSGLIANESFNYTKVCVIEGDKFFVIQHVCLMHWRDTETDPYIVFLQH